MATIFRVTGPGLDYLAEDNPSAVVRLDEKREEQTAMFSRCSSIGREGRVKGARELVWSSVALRLLRSIV
jgi:hypothetical protein